jgi:hypothetical protein
MLYKEWETEEELQQSAEKNVWIYWRGSYRNMKKTA